MEVAFRGRLYVASGRVTAPGAVTGLPVKILGTVNTVFIYLQAIRLCRIVVNQPLAAAHIHDLSIGERSCNCVFVKFIGDNPAGMMAFRIGTVAVENC